jgi:hypothetical protein
MGSRVGSPPPGSVDQLGTAAQPEQDHTADGTHCFVTGQHPLGGELGDNDVEGGFTTLPTHELMPGSDGLATWEIEASAVVLRPRPDPHEREDR